MRAADAPVLARAGGKTVENGPRGAGDRPPSCLLILLVLLAACASNPDYTPEEYVQTIRGYIAFPEPVAVKTWKWMGPADTDIELQRATIEYRKQTADWLIVVNENWWERATHSQRITTLGHEVCHAVYDHDLLMPDLWYAVSKDELAFRNARARECSYDLLGRMARD